MVRAVWNTVVLAVVTAIACIVLSILVSWFVVRGKRESRPLAHLFGDDSVSASKAFPSIVIGLALIFVYVRFPVPIYERSGFRSGDDDALSRVRARAQRSALVQVTWRARRGFPDVRSDSGSNPKPPSTARFSPLDCRNVFFWVAVHAT